MAGAWGAGARLPPGCAQIQVGEIQTKGGVIEELKLLVGMVADLPSMALWVIAAFWAYKVVVVGSIYGVIRFVVEKTHSWLTTPKHELVVKEVRPILDSMVIRGQLEALIAQIRRVAGKGTGIESDYLHSQSVDWLREVIDEKVERDRAASK